MDARETLIQRIVDESCGGCSGEHVGVYPEDHPHAGPFYYECEMDDYEHCKDCDCWSHLASRALDQWDHERRIEAMLRAFRY
jgi:hypothetical protein